MEHMKKAIELKIENCNNVADQYRADIDLDGSDKGPLENHQLSLNAIQYSTIRNIPLMFSKIAKD